MRAWIVWCLKLAHSKSSRSVLLAGSTRTGRGAVRRVLLAQTSVLILALEPRAALILVFFSCSSLLSYYSPDPSRAPRCPSFPL